MFFYVQRRVPLYTFDMNIVDFLSILALFVCMYMSYIDQTPDIKETLGRESSDNAGVFEVFTCSVYKRKYFVIGPIRQQIGSNHTENVFCVFGRVHPYTCGMNMRSCV